MSIRSSRRSVPANLNTRIKFQTTLVAAALVVAGAPLARANIVVNGSFEEPLIGTRFVFYPQGSTAITGWTVTAPSASQGVDISNATRYGNPNWAFVGVQSVDLAGSPGRGGIQQSLPTSPGQPYTLSFALSTNGDRAVAASVSVFWDGTLIDTLTSPAFGTWQVYNYNVVGASGSSSLLSFVGNTDGNFGTLIDNVVVVPSPTSAALLGLGGLMAARRRR